MLFIAPSPEAGECCAFDRLTDGVFADLVHSDLFLGDLVIFPEFCPIQSPTFTVCRRF